MALRAKAPSANPGAVASFRKAAFFFLPEIIQESSSPLVAGPLLDPLAPTVHGVDGEASET